ncbi:ABC transporter ATP-binding protein [Desulfobacterales bacterium HSG16]|nr:ABC transporter ATP-binding protein [Desulfobacterales bacterium HSG16]
MPNETDSCFEFKDVSFSWPNGGRTVLNRETFTIPAGIFAMVRGPSGSGKSTLLRMLARLEEPQKGVISYRNHAIADYDPPKLRQQVAYLSQIPVVPDVTVREALLMPFSYGVNKNLDAPSDDDLAIRLDEVLLGEIRLNERAAALSGGQKQRLCLLRALMIWPDVLLLDEPTASLDRESQAVVEQMAEQLCIDGVTVVMVTHNGFSPRDVPMTEILIQEGRVKICQ